MVSRAALVERLVYDSDELETTTPDDEDGDSTAGRRKRTWKDMPAFIEDSLAEVDQKLAGMEPEIWGKLIVMEKNFRTAKAYLRNQVIGVDNGFAEFDGSKMGLNHFYNCTRDRETSDELMHLGHGFRLKIDSHGSLWIKNESEHRIFIKTVQRQYPKFLDDSRWYRAFDLKAFKQTVLAKGAANREWLREAAFIYVAVGSADHASFLKTPLWLVIIHLIAIELIDAIANMSTPSFLESALSVGVGTNSRRPRGSAESADSANFSGAESSASSSGYAAVGHAVKKEKHKKENTRFTSNLVQQRPLPSACAPANHYNRSKSSVYFSIPQSLKNHSYETPIRNSNTDSASVDKKASNKPSSSRSRSQPRFKSTSSPEKSTTNSEAPNVINLRDIDKIKNPPYFNTSQGESSTPANILLLGNRSRGVGEKSGIETNVRRPNGFTTNLKRQIRSKSTGTKLSRKPYDHGSTISAFQ